MNKISSRLKVGASTIALMTAASFSAYAQQAAAPAGGDSDIEQVVVSASRISIAGYTQPTPVTVVGADLLERESNTDIGDTIRELPSVGASGSPNNASSQTTVAGAGNGVDTVNLRNLGVVRTLVLFDGQRVVQSNITGGSDLATIPTALVQRIDVVTGGASAAWGSDAVAGVVNLIINKNFDGIKVNIEGGDSYLNDHRQVKFDGSWGTGFAGGRAHITLSGAYIDSPDRVFQTQRSWYNDTSLVSNPAYTPTNGQPVVIHANNVGASQETNGGLITSSPAVTAANSPSGVAVAANVLRGIQFVGPTATPTPYNFGNITGPVCNNCSGNQFTGDQPFVGLADPYHQATLFGYGSYKVTDSILASVQLNYGDSTAFDTSEAGIVQFTNILIHSDNAYIPASVRSIIQTSGITSFSMGTTNTNNINPASHLTLQNVMQGEIGLPYNRNARNMMRGVVSLEGELGNDWSWNTYYQHGIVRVRLQVSLPVTANLNNAYDAVTVTPQNVGTSGLAIGSVTCRSTLAAPTNGCYPLDIFGTGVASAQAINYIRTNQDNELYILNEDVMSGSMQGKLPWALPAGQVAVAFGAEYRKEGGTIVADPGGLQKAFSVGNFTPFSGQYYVYEGFAEVDAPILKNDAVQSLDFNMAGRMTSYSTSGLVETWKLGLTSQVNDDVRLRGTWSFDIRAPDLSELFNPLSIASGQATDPKTGKTVSIFTESTGNANLLPEEAITLSGGIVLTPHFLQGFNMSLDWYSISIHGAILTTSAAQVLAQCNAGIQLYCSQLLYNGTAYPGALGTEVSQPLNQASQTTSGMDFNADYDTDLFTGQLRLRAVGNYTDELTQTSATTPNGKFDSAGSVGADSFVTGFPKFRTTLSATYAEGPFQGTIQGRMFGAAVLNNAWNGINYVDKNYIPPVAYLDLRASYDWTANVNIYAAVDNTTNTPPPAVPSTPAIGYAPGVSQSAPVTYDGLGRAYRVGIRLNW